MGVGRYVDVDVDVDVGKRKKRKRKRKRKAGDAIYLEFGWLKIAHSRAGGRAI